MDNITNFNTDNGTINNWGEGRIAMRKIIKAGLNADEMREILQEVLKDFKDDLIQEIKEALKEPEAEINLDDTTVSTNEVCKLWGKSRTTICKLIKSKKLNPSGKYKRQFLFLTTHIIRLFGPPKNDLVV